MPQRTYYLSGSNIIESPLNDIEAYDPDDGAILLFCGDMIMHSADLNKQVGLK